MKAFDYMQHETDCDSGVIFRENGAERIGDCTCGMKQAARELSTKLAALRGELARKDAAIERVIGMCLDENGKVITHHRNRTPTGLAAIVQVLKGAQ